MVRLTGQRSGPTLPGRDTPRSAELVSAPDDLAESAQSARSAWRSVTLSIAGTPHVRISRDGCRTYPARHARPLPADPPQQPATVPVYDAGAAAGQMLALDLDPSRGDVARQAAELGQLLERRGARYIADVATSTGGRHLLIPFAAPLPWLELRDLCRAIAARFPVVDPAPMCSLGGQISPPGSRAKRGGWRVLSTPLSEVPAAVEYPNGPETWAALLTEFAAELQQVETSSATEPVSSATAELDDTGVLWVPRLGGRANLGPELAHTAWNSYSYGQGQSTGRREPVELSPPAGA